MADSRRCASALKSRVVRANGGRHLAELVRESEVAERRDLCLMPTDSSVVLSSLPEYVWPLNEKRKRVSASRPKAILTSEASLANVADGFTGTPRFITRSSVMLTDMNPVVTDDEPAIATMM